MYDKNTFEHCYDELQTFHPTFHLDIYEMREILWANGRQLDELIHHIDKAIYNNFILESDEEIISRLEAFLWIPTDKQKPLYERRRLVFSCFVGFGKVSATKIKKIISVFTPAPCEVSFMNSTISIEITRDIDDSYLLADCYFIIRKKIPAHLDLMITLISSFEASYYIGSEITSYKEEVICS